MWPGLKNSLALEYVECKAEPKSSLNANGMFYIILGVVSPNMNCWPEISAARRSTSEAMTLPLSRLSSQRSPATIACIFCAAQCEYTAVSPARQSPYPPQRFIELGAVTRYAWLALALQMMSTCPFYNIVALLSLEDRNSASFSTGESIDRRITFEPLFSSFERIVLMSF